MEKVKFKNSKGEVLVGNFHTPKVKTDRAVIVAHGFTSSKDRERTVKLAEALCKEGYGVLRFNFGGSEGSYKTDLRLSYQVDDLRSAIDYVKNNGYARIGLASESLGSLISIMAYSKNIVDAMVFHAPVTTRKYYDGSKAKGVSEGGIVLGKGGRFKKDGIWFKVGKEYF